MDAIDGALATFARQLAADAPLRTAQQVAATRFLDCFLKFLHHHHHNGAAGSAHCPTRADNTGAAAPAWLRLSHSSRVTKMYCSPGGALAEDDIVVPYLSTRFEVDKKVGADHRKLEVGHGWG